jgi:hypothetical protein
MHLSAKIVIIHNKIMTEVRFLRVSKNLACQLRNINKKTLRMYKNSLATMVETT